MEAAPQEAKEEIRPAARNPTHAAAAATAADSSAVAAAAVRARGPGGRARGNEEVGAGAGAVCGSHLRRRLVGDGDGARGYTGM